MWNIMNAPLTIEIREVLAIVRQKHFKEWNKEAELKAFREST
jgi:hypothetical protein